MRKEDFNLQTKIADWNLVQVEVSARVVDLIGGVFR